MSDRCPHCSFNPTSNSDFCDDHRGVTKAELHQAVKQIQDAVDADWLINPEAWEIVRRGMRNVGLAP